MPTLAELQGTSLTQIASSHPVIEPLDGPTSVEDIYDHFPPEVYQQGRDTHLYRLLAALCGDAGAGFLKTQSYQLRLRYEAELITGNSLNEVYGHQFQISRLPDETYSYHPDDSLTPSQVDQVVLADQSYYHRAQEFFTAVRYGNSPLGLVTMAQAGSGVPADIVEHYKYIFDQYSDSPLGLTPLGHTTSTSEYVILSRLLAGGFTTREWTAPRGWNYVFTPPILNTGVGRPVPAPTGGNVLQATRTYSGTTSTQLIPEVERNMVNLLDQLQPTGTLGTVAAVNQRYTEVALASTPVASSERILVSRFVTGAPGVTWPDVDPSSGLFIESGVENEATSIVGLFPELPIIFHTIERVDSYTDDALRDPTYGSSAFYTTMNGAAPVDHYTSEHIGTFYQVLASVFPILANVSFDTQFLPDSALAAQNTPLRLKN